MTHEEKKFIRIQFRIWIGLRPSTKHKIKLVGKVETMT
jgi:hypothetical protein